MGKRRKRSFGSEHKKKRVCIYDEPSLDGTTFGEQITSIIQESRVVATSFAPFSIPPFPLPLLHILKSEDIPHTLTDYIFRWFSSTRVECKDFLVQFDSFLQECSKPPYNIKINPKTLLENILSIPASNDTETEREAFSYSILFLWRLHELHLISMIEFLSICPEIHMKYMLESCISLLTHENTSCDIRLFPTWFDNLICFLCTISLDSQNDISPRVTTWLKSLFQFHLPQSGELALAIFYTIKRSCNKEIVVHHCYTLLELMLSEEVAATELFAPPLHVASLSNVLSTMPKLPDVSNNFIILFGEVLSIFGTDNDKLWEKLLYLFQCRSPYWNLLFHFLSIYYKDLNLLDGEPLAIIKTKLLFPIVTSIGRHIGLQDECTASEEESNRKIQSLIILVRFVMDSLGQGDTFSLWFSDWLKLLGSVKAQKMVMNSLLQMQEYDSSYYIAVHIRGGLPEGTSKTIRALVASYVQQGTKRLYHLGYLLSNADGIENDFFTESYLSRKVLSILFCFRPPRIPLALNTAYLYHPEWYRNHFIPFLSTNCQLPLQDPFFTLFSKKNELEALEEIEIKKKDLYRHLKDSGMLEEMEKAHHGKEKQNKEIALSSWHSQFKKLKKKFMKLIEEWKQSITTPKEGWILSMEEIAKVAKPSSCPTIDHPVFSLGSIFISTICEWLEERRKGGTIEQRASCFIQHALSTKVFWRIIERYLESYLIDNIHKHSAITRNGISYFLAVLSSLPPSDTYFQKANEYLRKIWVHLHRIPAEHHTSVLSFVISFFHTFLVLQEENEDIFFGNSVYFPLLLLQGLHRRFLFSISSADFPSCSLEPSISYFGISLEPVEFVHALSMSGKILQSPKIVSHQTWNNWFLFELLLLSEFHPSYRLFMRNEQMFYLLRCGVRSQHFLVDFLVALLTPWPSYDLYNEKNSIHIMQIIGSELVQPFMVGKDKTEEIFFLFIFRLCYEELDSRRTRLFITRLFHVVLPYISPIWLVQNSIVPHKVTEKQMEQIVSFLRILPLTSPVFSNITTVHYLFRMVHVLAQVDSLNAVLLLQRFPKRLGFPFLRFWSQLSSQELFSSNLPFWDSIDLISTIPSLLLAEEETWGKKEGREYSNEGKLGVTLLESVWNANADLCSYFWLVQMIEELANNTCSAEYIIQQIVLFMGEVLDDQADSLISLFLCCRDYLCTSMLSSNIKTYDSFVVSLLVRLLERTPCLFCFLVHSRPSSCIVFKKENLYDEEIISVCDGGIRALVVFQVLKSFSIPVNADLDQAISFSVSLAVLESFANYLMFSRETIVDKENEEIFTILTSSGVCQAVISLFVDQIKAIHSQLFLLNDKRISDLLNLHTNLIPGKYVKAMFSE